MNLRDRLALARPPVGGPARSRRAASVPSSPPAAAGYVQESWSVRCGAALGPSDILPSGFSSLALPSRTALIEGLRELETGPTCGGPPAVAVDLETTGGFGQAAVPFIVGAAWHTEEDTICITQWTLEDGRGEAPMLLDVVRRLVGLAGRSPTSGPRLLSFNGASFDLPVLRGRLRRAGAGAALDVVSHVDLLTAARRLWRGRVPDCRLTTLEARMLDVRRLGDMAGAEVAEVFPQLLANPGDPWVRGQLERAKRHNRGDLLGLLALGAKVGQHLRAPVGPTEALRSAQHYLRSGQHDAAWQRLETIPSADSLPAELRVTYVRARAELCRRRGNPEGAAAQWQWLCTHDPGNIEAHEQLAKYFEHVVRDFGAALRVAESSRCPCPRRLARLVRKTTRV